MVGDGNVEMFIVERDLGIDFVVCVDFCWFEKEGEKE